MMDKREIEEILNNPDEVEWRHLSSCFNADFDTRGAVESLESSLNKVIKFNINLCKRLIDSNTLTKSEVADLLFYL